MPPKLHYRDIKDRPIKIIGEVKTLRQCAASKYRDVIVETSVIKDLTSVMHSLMYKK